MDAAELKDFRDNIEATIAQVGQMELTGKKIIGRQAVLKGNSGKKFSYTEQFASELANHLKVLVRFHGTLKKVACTEELMADDSLGEVFTTKKKIFAQHDDLMAWAEKFDFIAPAAKRNKRKAKVN